MYCGVDFTALILRAEDFGAGQKLKSAFLPAGQKPKNLKFEPWLWQCDTLFHYSNSITPVGGHIIPT